MRVMANGRDETQSAAACTMPASTPESIDEVALDANDLHRLIGRLDHPLD